MSTSLIKRFASAGIALTVLWMANYYFQATGVYFLSVLVFMIMSYECGLLLFKKKSLFVFILPLHFLHFIFFYTHPKLENIFLFCILELLLWIWVQRKAESKAQNLYANHDRIYEFLFYSLIAPTFLLAHLIIAPHYESLFFLFFIVASFDTFSYFWGKFLGNKIFTAKLYPYSSPSKTIEGAALAALTCVPLTLVLDHHLTDYSVLNKIESLPLKALCTLALLLAALTGDLSESFIKRSANIKDSGSLLPGHGGFFDRLDGMLLTGILSYLLIQF